MRNLRPMTLKETRGPAVRPLIPVVFGAEESVVCGFEALRGCDDEMAWVEGGNKCLQTYLVGVVVAADGGGSQWSGVEWSGVEWSRVE